MGLPWWLRVKNPPTMQKTGGSIPESGRFSGEGNSNPLQYSCLGNTMDGEPGRLRGVTRDRHNLAPEQLHVYKWDVPINFFVSQEANSAWTSDSFKSSFLGFPGCSVVKNSPPNAGDMGLIPGLEGFHIPGQLSCCATTTEAHAP